MYQYENFSQFPYNIPKPPLFSSVSTLSILMMSPHPHHHTSLSLSFLDAAHFLVTSQDLTWPSLFSLLAIYVLEVLSRCSNFKIDSLCHWYIWRSCWLWSNTLLYIHLSSQQAERICITMAAKMSSARSLQYSFPDAVLVRMTFFLYE